MTLRQPTAGHGSNAGIGEEVTVTAESETDHPVVFGIPADVTDEELRELAKVIVAAPDQQAADHRETETGR